MTLSEDPTWEELVLRDWRAEWLSDEHDADYEALYQEMKQGPEPRERADMGSTEQADGHSRRAGGFHQFLKNQKNRKERRRAKANPSCIPTYGRYSGYET